MNSAEHREELNKSLKSTLEESTIEKLIEFSLPEEKLDKQEEQPHHAPEEDTADEDESKPPTLNLAKDGRVRKKLQALFKDGSLPDLSTCRDKNADCDAKCMAVLNLSMFSRSFSAIHRTIDFVNLLNSLVNEVKNLKDDTRKDVEPRISLIRWKAIHADLSNLISMFESPKDFLPDKKLDDEDFESYVLLERHYQYSKYPKDDLWPWDKRIHEFFKLKLKSEHISDTKTEYFVDSLRALKTVSDRYLKYNIEEIANGNGTGDEKFQLLFKKNKSESEEKKNGDYINIGEVLDLFIRYSDLHRKPLKNNVKQHLVETCLSLHKGLEGFDDVQNLSESLLDIKKRLPHNNKSAYKIWATKEIAENE